MLMHNSAQSYARPITNGPLRQQLARRHNFELPGGVALWKQASKFGGVVVLVVCCCQLILGGIGRGIHETQELTRVHQGELENSFISLRAERATLMMPANIEKLAAAKLSLQSPVNGQVSSFSKKKGRFVNQ